MTYNDRNDDWPIDEAWVDIDRRMTHEDFKEYHLTCQDWIWFDDATPFGCCMCINSRESFKYLGDTLQTLLDNAVVDGKTYTLTRKENSGRHTQSPWYTAYTQFSQFAEWGYQMMPEDRYRNVHQIRTFEKTLDDFIRAGIEFSHIILVERED